MLSRIAAFMVLFVVFGGSAQASGPVDLRVLYAGNLRDARSDDFRSFLEANVKEVGLVSLPSFREIDADNYDVVVFDWSLIYDGKGSPVRWKPRSKPPKLSQTFSRPSIIIGETAGRMSQQLKLKTNWLCLCLKDSAHTLDPTHQIFQSPREVSLTLEEVDTPATFQYMAITLGLKMHLWRVQDKNYPEVDPGLASDVYGFEDSPDAEVIARGISSKGPDTASIARHGNFLLWGYSAQPSDMTQEGRDVFVNALVYMQQFDGQLPLVRREKTSRRWALRMAAFPRMTSDDYLNAEAERIRQSIAEYPHWLPKKYRGNVEDYVAERIQSLRESYGEALERYFPQDLRDAYGDDATKYIQYYSENMEYLYPSDNNSFVVDEDVKTLGVSNREVILLERCIEMLEKHDRPRLARRVLARYTTEDFSEASQWRSWLSSNVDSLFFSDVGGFKFFVAP